MSISITLADIAWILVIVGASSSVFWYRRLRRKSEMRDLLAEELKLVGEQLKQVREQLEWVRKMSGNLTKQNSDLVEVLQKACDEFSDRYDLVDNYGATYCKAKEILNKIKRGEYEDSPN